MWTLQTATRRLAIGFAAAGLLAATMWGCQGPAGPAGGALTLYQRSDSFTCSSGGPNCNVPALLAACDPGDVAVSGTAYRIAPGFPDQDRVSFPDPRGVTTASTGWT